MKTVTAVALGVVLSLLVPACASESPLDGDGDDDDDDAGATSGAAGPSAVGAGGGSQSGATGSGPSATSGTGGASCAGIFGGACGSCLEAACCTQLANCDATAGCVDCVVGEGDAGCQEAPAANALLECASGSCLAECFERGSSSSGSGGGSSSGSSGSGGGGGFDTVNCTGPASSSGTVLGVTPDPTLGYVWPDPSGALAVALYPKLSTVAGDISIGVYFFPSPGQLDYPPNGTVGCAILEDTGSSWSAVDTTQLCEVHLSQLQFASAPDVCDGVIEGTFQGIFSGNAPLAGAFSLPLEVAESQTSPPSCQPPNGPCSQHSDCCSQSCSIFIGVCN